MSEPSTWRFEYQPGTLLAGPEAVAELRAELARRNLERALVVCGRTVGETDAVMDPVRDGLGDRLAGVFAETTPEKRLATAIAGRERVNELDADAIVAVGGGSSLDTAKAIALLGATDREPEELGAEFAESGTLSVPEGSLLPIIAVPTTLAGADLSRGAGLSAHPEGGLVDTPVNGGIGDARLMPTAIVGDPALVATTPRDILTGSAMNGFDKGIESLYARNATPVTDATAMRGLSILSDALPALGTDPLTAETLDPVVTGNLLVQYGVSQPDRSTLSIIHAFGHGLRRTSGIQQGIAHAVLAPHVLEYLFEHVDGQRDLLATALGVSDADDQAAAIVQRVRDVRDAMGLPSRLRDVDGPTKEAYQTVAELTLADSIIDNSPPGLDPTLEELAAVLHAAH